MILVKFFLRLRALKCTMENFVSLIAVIDSYVPMKKQGKRSKKKHLSKEDFRKIRHKQKYGGFINIRERIKIMRLTKRH